jgi:hypothetical protein
MAAKLDRLVQNAFVAGTRASWTPERRARQREIIRSTKPWTRSTGPRTPEGKAKSSKNAAHFRNDPLGRRAFRAMQMILKYPSSRMAADWWRVIETVSDASVWQDMDPEIVALEWALDAAADDLFDLPLD